MKPATEATGVDCVASNAEGFEALQLLERVVCAWKSCNLRENYAAIPRFAPLEDFLTKARVAATIAVYGVGPAERRRRSRCGEKITIL